jgi:hypothetical protein
MEQLRLPATLQSFLWASPEARPRRSGGAGLLSTRRRGRRGNSEVPVAMRPSDGDGRSSSGNSLQARARGCGGGQVRVMIYSSGTPRLAGATFEYSGGDVRSALIPVDCSYFELMHYLIEEKGLGPCSVRYECRVPHAELVSISSQDDLECAMHMASTLRLFVDECAEGDMMFVDDGYDGISLVASEDLDEMDAWLRESDDSSFYDQRSPSPWDVPAPEHVAPGGLSSEVGGSPF